MADFKSKLKFVPRDPKKESLTLKVKPGKYRFSEKNGKEPIENPEFAKITQDGFIPRTSAEEKRLIELTKSKACKLHLVEIADRPLNALNAKQLTTINKDMAAELAESRGGMAALEAKLKVMGITQEDLDKAV